MKGAALGANESFTKQAEHVPTDNLKKSQVQIVAENAFNSLEDIREEANPAEVPAKDLINAEEQNDSNLEGPKSQHSGSQIDAKDSLPEPDKAADEVIYEIHP